MKFDKTRIYTSANADELKIGSKCIFADTLAELRALVQECEGYSKSELREIREDDEVYRFVDKVGHTSALAYLLLSPDEPKYKPFESIDKAMEAIKKHGGWIKKKSNGYQYIVIAKSSASLRLFDGWFTFEAIFYDYVFADDDSLCGELVEP